jgi:protein-tyrosine phosphatase
VRSAMIDLHCHILPELDDGALDLQDSIAMALQAERDGIAVVCATPHIRPDHDVSIEGIAGRVSALQHQLDERGIAVRVMPGGEIAESEIDRLTDADLHLAALGGAGGWVLLEPAAGPLGESIRASVERLAERGLGTVLAHPERHAGSGFRDLLDGLASAGCLIQWTAEFVAQASPPDLVVELAREGLVHLLGSDAHSSHAGRPVRLAAAFARLASIRTPAQMAWSMELAPQAILDRRPVINPP